MSFWQRLMRAVEKPFRTKQSMPIAESSKYADWSKEQLVERLLQLENEITYQPGKLKPSLASSETKASKNRKPSREFDFSKYSRRFIALKFAYLGWNYNGLAVQKEPTPLPTVEGVIIEALNKCKLVPSLDPHDFRFSRCGRTDKGVSAMSQVISLFVRSNLSEEEQSDPKNDSKEIQYVNILNQLLPEDIRVSAVSLRPPKGFDARFSCQYRHYRYLFHKDGLDVGRMDQAAALFKGEHDFRNFCKLDGSKQITNYARNIISAKIIPLSGDFYCFDLIGSAFLWHQVRCMMANLFLVGQGLENVSLISDMLDVDKTPRKPIYDMASDIPLILYDCKFPDIEWVETNVDDYKAIKYGKAVSALTLSYHLKATVAQIFKEVLPSTATELSGKTRINLGDGKGKVVTSYEKMLKRNVMETAEVVNEKFRHRKRTKFEAQN
ncbi:pseudouridine synthase DEG1 TDEL_0C01170 [Torulaspora delbrueckii]|uniref:Pseudouridine synthase I TruA alpha/beta domain-containing protein n=1 Tax=Torulaspora delbrueckii TaxID=4950 RepID=G8ZR64_TORDE|nr:hypothetical protein TDEL_0C01170 [Torulaspora delbrueckii]CCE91006.1 hypothetical protein TDEL_0C01170 [Torulaspora delbrueckii]